MSYGTLLLLSPVEDRVRFEALVADLAARFINLSPEEVDREIEEAQRQLVEALDLDRSSLFELSTDAKVLTLTHHWSRPEFAPMPKVMTEEQFPWIASKIRQGEVVCLPSLDDLPSESVDHANLRMVGVKSNISVPLQVSGHVVGVLTFGTLRQERCWETEIVNRLRLVAQVFASALARKRGDEELRAALGEVQRLRDRLRDEKARMSRPPAFGVIGIRVAAVRAVRRGLVERAGAPRASAFGALSTPARCDGDGADTAADRLRVGERVSRARLRRGGLANHEPVMARLHHPTDERYPSKPRKGDCAS
jgi:transcriptional regulator with GAF, ATPase, and Fis domain